MFLLSPRRTGSSYCWPPNAFWRLSRVDLATSPSFSACAISASMSVDVGSPPPPGAPVREPCPPTRYGFSLASFLRARSMAASSLAVSLGRWSRASAGSLNFSRDATVVTVEPFQLVLVDQLLPLGDLGCGRLGLGGLCRLRSGRCGLLRLLSGLRLRGLLLSHVLLLCWASGICSPRSYAGA